MYLKTLVLKGFKSFADKVTLNLEPGITAIVGPNGSGKSNISDAVLWVLGERNAKHLRGNSMEDVIFAGSSARKPTSFAEVTLVLDNTDHTLDVDYAQVSITRRMYKSGESEYLINDTLARRMDILDILHDSGLGTGTHSIISQGSLDSVLQSKPEERRALIEEAAGVLKHKQRLERSARKLEKMSNNVARISDVVQEIARQLRPLERKAKQAKTYAELSEELRGAKLALAVDDLRTLRTSHASAVEHEETANEQLSAISVRIEETERKLEAVQEEIRVSTEGAGELSSKSRAARAVLEHIDACILMARERVRQCDERALELTLALERDEAEHAALVKDFERLKADADESAVAFTQAQEEVVALEAKGAELKGQLEEESALHASYIEEEGALEALIIDLTEKQTRLREELASDVAQIKVTEDKIDELTRTTTRMSADVSSLDQEALALEASLVALQEEEKQARTLVASCIQARSQADEAHAHATQAVASIDAQINAFEEIERSRLADAGEVVGWIEEHKARLGLKASPLSHALKIEPGYEGLLERLLSSDARALVLESYGSLSRVLSGLEEDGIKGSAAFFIADGAQKRAFARSQAPQLPDGVFYLTDIIECEPQIEDVVNALLGDVAVCSDLSQALSCHKEIPACIDFATPAGDIVRSTGKVSLGSVTEDAASNDFVRLARIEELKRSLIEAKKVSEAALAETKTAESALARAQEESLALSEKLARLRGGAGAARDEADRAAEKLTAQTQELERTRERLASYQSSLDSAKPDAERVRIKLEESKERLAEVKALIESSQHSQLPISSQLEEVTFALNEARLALAKESEKSEYQKRVLLRHIQDMEKISLRKDESVELRRTKEYISRRMTPLIERMSALSEVATDIALKLEVQASDAVGKSEEKLALINELREAGSSSHAEYSRVAEELSQAKIARTKLEMQVEAAVKVITEDCGTSLETALTCPELEDRGATEELIFKLTRRISNLGTINPDAAHDFDELKERYDFMFGQLEDLNRATRSLRRINNIIESRMKEDFAQTFEMVNENFKEIFSVLFPNGSGYLSLIDPDDIDTSGIEVNAQPAGKRIRKMSLMSGGEKSLTALALLFALYKTRATPFYILDEVEAALDDTNLRRLTAYINAMRSTTQMIMITHQRRTMESADVLFGVSMQSDGVTKVISQKLDAALKNAE